MIAATAIWLYWSLSLGVASLGEYVASAVIGQTDPPATGFEVSATDVMTQAGTVFAYFVGLLVLGIGIKLAFKALSKAKNIV